MKTWIRNINSETKPLHGVRDMPVHPENQENAYKFLFARKLMVAVCLDREGILLVDFLNVVTNNFKEKVNH